MSSLVCLLELHAGSSQIVSVGLDVCCPSLFSKTALLTFMKLYIMLSYVLFRKPIEFGVNWSMIIKLIMIKTEFLLILSFHLPLSRVKHRGASAVETGKDSDKSNRLSYFCPG